MNPKIEISDEEYRYLISLLQFYDETRNRILMFSFTGTFTIMGFVLGTEVSIWLCVLPFLLIIPFSARVSYYRRTHAHLNSFLGVFAPEKMLYKSCSSQVKNRYGRSYPFVAWLVNNEMSILAIMTFVVYLLKVFSSGTGWNFESIMLCSFLCIATLIVFLISNSTLSYAKINCTYLPKWESLLQKMKETTSYKIRQKD